MSAARSILHVDMDAFYASVEQRDDPSLQGRPVVVGGQTRGVVAAASYEARKFGIRSAMPMRDALRRCPELIRIRPRMDHYRSVSRVVFGIFREFTPLVEGLSLDEAFLDVTASVRLHGDGVSIARSIKRRILEETGLTASVGVAPNKLVAKIASDLDKPDGLFIVTEQNLRDILDPLPAAVIPGIGPQTRNRLEGVGIHTVGELRLAPAAALQRVFGRYAERTRERASGIDERPVQPLRADKSISAENTFPRDLSKTPDMQRELLRLCEKTAERMRSRNLVAGTLQVKIRRSDFSTCTRQCSLQPPANGTEILYARARYLLDEWLQENGGARIRLLGVGGSELRKDTQPDLFALQDPPAQTGLDKTVDEIRERFGDDALARARAMNPGQIR